MIFSLLNKSSKGFSQLVCASSRGTPSGIKRFNTLQGKPLELNGGFIKICTLNTVLSFSTFLMFSLGIWGPGAEKVKRLRGLSALMERRHDNHMS